MLRAGRVQRFSAQNALLFFFDRGELLKKLAKMSGGRHFDPITDGDFANGLP